MNRRTMSLQKIGLGRFLSPFVIVASMVVASALFGGASRADSLAQVPLRVLLPLLLAGALLSGPPGHWRELRPLLMFTGATVLLAAVMLVPLPPELWAKLPGRYLVAPAATAAGLEQPWRPIALSPPLGWNALWSLIPPACVAAGLSWLSWRQRSQLLPLVLAIALASALLGLAQKAGGAGSSLRWYAYTSSDSAVGLFANRNHQALLLAIGFPLTAWWTLRGREEQRHYARIVIGCVIAAIFAVSIVTTGSRAGLVVGALALAGTAVIHRYALLAAIVRAGRRERIVALVVAASVVVGSIFIALSPQAVSITRLFDNSLASDMRLSVAGTIIDVVRAHFPVGTGMGGFQPAYEAFEPAALLRRQYLNEAHNDYLQLALEGGLAGCVLLFAFGSWCVFHLVKIVHRGNAHPDAEIRLTGALVILLIAIASAVDYPLRTGFMMVVLVIAASWLGAHEPKRD